MAGIEIELHWNLLLRDCKYFALITVDMVIIIKDQYDKPKRLPVMELLYSAVSRSIQQSPAITAGRQQQRLNALNIARLPCLPLCQCFASPVSVLNITGWKVGVSPNIAESQLLGDLYRR